jgi:hypothetical protein
MNYCEISDIEAYTLKEIDPSFEPQVTKWIGSVSRLMDTMANRVLVAPVVGSGEDYETKYYDGDDEPYCLIHDCQEIVSVSIGDVWGENLVETDNFVVRPRIAPHSNVILKGDIFPKGVQNIAIEGRFGLFNAIPDDIRQACVVIVSGIVNNQVKGGQMTKQESIGNYSVTYSDEKQFDDFETALDIIKSYKKYDF